MTAASALSPPERLSPFERALWCAVAPTLERVGMLPPNYAPGFEGLIQQAGVYFRLRHALGDRPVDRRTVRVLHEMRAQLLRSCSNFRLRSPRRIVRDEVDARAADAWLEEVFAFDVALLARERTD